MPFSRLFVWGRLCRGTWRADFIKNQVIDKCFPPYKLYLCGSRCADVGKQIGPLVVLAPDVVSWRVSWRGVG